LVGRRREADHLATDGANFVGHPLKERRDQAAHRQHRLQKTVLHLARPKEGQVLCVRLGGVTERRDGEDPVSEPGVDSVDDGVVLGDADSRFVGKTRCRGVAMLQEGEPERGDLGLMPAC
jgi:hypothetical protein